MLHRIYPQSRHLQLQETKNEWKTNQGKEENYSKQIYLIGRNYQ